MARAAWTLALVFAAACIPPRPDTGDTTDTDDTGVSDGCPDDLVAAQSPGLFINSYTYDGLGKSPVFEEGDVDLGGGATRPAACISDDGRSVDFVFLLVGEPYGRVEMF